MHAPFKKQTLLGYLERGIAMLHLDARRPGVSVPAQYAQNPDLRLNLSYRYQIHDLEIGDDGVQATLSFGGRPFHCVVPWEAIYGISSHTAGDELKWPEDMPAELAGGVEEPEAERRPALAAVEGEEQPPDEEPPRPKGPPHLRLVR